MHLFILPLFKMQNGEYEYATGKNILIVFRYIDVCFL